MSIDDVASHYMESVPLSKSLPINVGLSSARDTTMASILGSPHQPLTTSCQNSLASDKTQSLRATRKFTPHLRATGVTPALDSLERVLTAAFAAHPDLDEVLRTQGMLCVRRRKPTNGSVSYKPSNHSWGTAIDLNIVGYAAPGNTGQSIPRFIAVLLPLFHAEGWYSGIAFQDTMHFEVAEETIRHWSQTGVI